MTVTSKHIAEHLGVSQSTVSLAMRDSSSISLQTRQRVREVARQFNYAPHPGARAMRTKRTQQVGVLVSELHNPTTGQRIEAIEQALSQHGYKLLLGMTRGRPEQVERYLREFSSGLVDGVINLDPQLEADELLGKVEGIHALTYSRLDTQSPATLDYVAGVKEAMEHLWSLGHRRIGMIAGPAYDFGANERLRGYFDFYRRQGSGQVASEWVRHGQWELADGESLVGELMEAGCTAVLASNDVMAVGALRGVRMAGRSVPGDMSVVGFDDSPIAVICEPNLTSVQIPLIQITQITVDYLVAMIEGKRKPRRRRLTPRLVVRDSTAPPR